MGLGELTPLTDLFANDLLPDESASIAAEVVVSNHRKVTELLRGQYVRTSRAMEELLATLVPRRIDTLSAAAAALVGALSVRDAAGAALSGDELTERTAAEIALEYALDTALFAAGDPYRSRKFLPRRLSRIPALAPLLDEIGRQRDARETLLLANGVQAAALLGAPLALAYDGDGPMRSPYVTLVQTATGLRLSGVTECAMGRPAAVLWLLADGRPLPRLTERFAELHGLQVADVTAFVETNVAKLSEMGALEPA